MTWSQIKGIENVCGKRFGRHLLDCGCKKTAAAFVVQYLDSLMERHKERPEVIEFCKSLKQLYAEI